MKKEPDGFLWKCNRYWVAASLGLRREMDRPRYDTFAAHQWGHDMPHYISLSLTIYSVCHEVNRTTPTVVATVGNPLWRNGGFPYNTAYFGFLVGVHIYPKFFAHT